MSTRCPLCATTLQADTNRCAACNAAFGYRDGKGKVRSRPQFLALGGATTLFAIIFYWLGVQVQFWLYYYPFMAFAALFALGTVIIATMLIRGPKWYNQ